MSSLTDPPALSGSLPQACISMVSFVTSFIVRFCGGGDVLTLSCSLGRSCVGDFDGMEPVLSVPSMCTLLFTASKPVDGVGTSTAAGIATLVVSVVLFDIDVGPASCEFGGFEAGG